MKRVDPNPQIDLFAPYVSDLPLRDQREMMERPFFSLSKRKRTKPIEYVSPDGGTFVRVTANPEFGMATIWDADVLIWAASTVQQMRSRGVNDIPRTLRFQPYDLLKTIHRHTGGTEYRSLREALARLQATTIVTNIRAGRGKKHRQFSWIESWTDDVDETRQLSRGMSLTLAEWFHEGILMDGGLLAIEPTLLMKLLPGYAKTFQAGTSMGFRRNTMPGWPIGPPRSQRTTKPLFMDLSDAITRNTRPDIPLYYRRIR